MTVRGTLRSSTLAVQSQDALQSHDGITIDYGVGVEHTDLIHGDCLAPERVWTHEKSCWILATVSGSQLQPRLPCRSNMHLDARRASQ